VFGAHHGSFTVVKANSGLRHCLNVPCGCAPLDGVEHLVADKKTMPSGGISWANGLFMPRLNRISESGMKKSLDSMSHTVLRVGSPIYSMAKSGAWSIAIS
jgi:hypothetical protein